MSKIADTLYDLISSHRCSPTSFAQVFNNAAQDDIDEFHASADKDYFTLADDLNFVIPPASVATAAVDVIVPVVAPLSPSVADVTAPAPSSGLLAFLGL
jgi:hypothetical protein